MNSFCLPKIDILVAKSLIWVALALTRLRRLDVFRLHGARQRLSISISVCFLIIINHVPYIVVSALETKSYLIQVYPLYGDYALFTNIHLMNV